MPVGEGDVLEVVDGSADGLVPVDSDAPVVGSALDVGVSDGGVEASGATGSGLELGAGVASLPSRSRPVSVSTIARISRSNFDSDLLHREDPPGAHRTDPRLRGRNRPEAG
ncbi:MAG: hypothetical protein LH461_08830 [Spirochaetaceae bacterium]|nr:hypothetical protein [Spirochaetaceae bacterium]